MSVLDDLAEEEVVENPTLRAAYNLAPLHQNEPLHWNYNVNLIGEKIYTKTIHLCELCELPILVYGRMLPCKHIFCFECARKCDKTCGRCDAKVNKVEKSALGTVYVCTHGASKHSTKGCRRTYLSQRDLQSHHAHRHQAKPSSSKQQQNQVSSNLGLSTSAASTVQPVPNQLPLTQQQAQQQASQIKLQQQQIAPRGLLSPSQGGMLTSAAMASQQSSLIPGLGGGHSSSPLVQPSVSPKLPLQQTSLSMTFPGGQPNQPISLSADVYRPLEVSGIGSDLQPQHRQLHHPQLQPHQQQGMLGLAPVNAHIPQGSSQSIQPPFGSQHFQMQPQQQQQLGLPLIQQMPPNVHQTPMSHQQQQHHQQIHQTQHPLVSASQSLDMYPQNSMSSPAVSSPGISSSMTNMSSHSRTNVNLITVPIQDEGQYRPLPFVSTSMGSSQSNPPLQTRSNQGGGNVNQTFLPHSMPGSYPGQLKAQDQSIVSIGSNSQPQGLSFNQGTQGNNPQGIHFSQAGGQRPPMGRGFNQLPGQTSGPRVGFIQGGHVGNQPFNPNSLSDTKSFHQGSHNANAPFNQGVPTGVQPFNPGLRINQLGNMSAGGGRGNLSGVVQAINMAPGVRPQGAGALRAGMAPGVPPGGGNNRFPRFPPGMQPRMGSNQNAPPRTHDSGFNQGPYYN